MVSHDHTTSQAKEDHSIRLFSLVKAKRQAWTRCDSMDEESEEELEGVKTEMRRLHFQKALLSDFRRNGWNARN